MRYRALTREGDYQFGYGSHFIADSPETVAQAVLTRMRLFRGEWFLDLQEGLDLDNVLGYGTHDTRDREMQQRMLGTRGVRSIVAYSSQVSGRQFAVAATLDTIYGTITIREVL